MHRFLLTTAQCLLVAFLLGGTAVVVGQIIAIAIGDGPLMETFGTTVTDGVCVVAGLAGVSAFLLLYTKQGKQHDSDSDAT